MITVMAEIISPYNGPCTVLHILHALLVLYINHKVGTIIPISQMGKLRHREVKQPA